LLDFRKEEYDKQELINRLGFSKGALVVYAGAFLEERLIYF
jgi:hypothetical protein